MGKVFILILVLILLAFVWCFPLWLVVNFVCWAFHLSFHLSFLQAFAVCLCASVLKSLLFGKEDK